MHGHAGQTACLMAFILESDIAVNARQMQIRLRWRRSWAATGPECRRTRCWQTQAFFVDVMRNAPALELTVRAAACLRIVSSLCLQAFSHDAPQSHGRQPFRYLTVLVSAALPHIRAMCRWQLHCCGHAFCPPSMISSCYDCSCRYTMLQIVTVTLIHDGPALVRHFQVMAVPTRDVPLRDARAGIEARLRDTLAQWGDSELSPAPKPEDEAALQSFLHSFEGAPPALFRLQSCVPLPHSAPSSFCLCKVAPISLIPALLWSHGTREG